MTSPDVYALAIDPQNPATLYAGPQGRVLKSADCGASWFPADAGLPRTSVGSTVLMQGLAVDPRNSLVLYVATNYGLFKSIDGGGGWTESGSGIVSFCCPVSNVY